MPANPIAASSLGRFIAGSLAPVAVAGAFLGLAGEASLSRLQSIGVVGTIVGAAVFALTVVLPCGLVALAGPRSGILSGFARGLLLPLGILALGLAARPAVETGEPTVDTVFAEAFRAVWTPGASIVAPPSSESADREPPETASLETLVALQDRVRDLTAERNRLRTDLRRVGAVALVESPDDAEARRARVTALEEQVDHLTRQLTDARENGARLRGHLENAESGLLGARREADEMRREVLAAKEEAQLARDDAAYEKKKFLAQIEALGESAAIRDLADLKAQALVPVGVVFEIQEGSRGKGLAIRTSGDATRVTGPGVVVDPQGRIVAVVRIGVGRGEALGATVLYTAPVGKVTPGDRIFAHIR